MHCLTVLLLIFIKVLGVTILGGGHQHKPDFFFQKDNKKSYKSSEQEKKAESNYVKAQSDIEAHNSRKNETFKRKATEDSDMSYAEKKVKRMGLKQTKKSVKALKNPKLSRRVKGADDDVVNSTDYRLVFLENSKCPKT